MQLRWIGGLRLGTRCGAISHKYKIPMDPAAMTGKAKSNMPNGATPRSRDTDTTSRLVDVPMAG